MMLLKTFLHLPGVGERREREIWREGIEDWMDYLSSPPPKGIGERRKEVHNRIIQNLLKALNEGRWNAFSNLLPPSQRWRLVEPLGRKAACLDIETEGISRWSPITVVGIYRDGRYLPLIRGYNLTSENIKRALEGASMIITFNGSSFDLPLLRRQFPDSIPPIPHLDLLHVARGAGLPGGLKNVERALGIERDEDVGGVDGEVAVRLWHLWRREGSRPALKLLIKYNREDTKNLRPLAQVLYTAMKMRTMGDLIN